MLYNNISNGHHDSCPMFTTTAQGRVFQHAASPLAKGRPAFLRKNPEQTAVKDFAYQPPIVGLLADLPSRV
jgi:hypothetical protein